MKIKNKIFIPVILAIISSILVSCGSPADSSSSKSSSGSSNSSQKTSSGDVNKDLKYSKLENIWNFKEPSKGDKVATLKTTMGDIQVVFFDKVAPKAVENFLTHAAAGYYNGLKFHRVIKDFMIQSGDPKGDGTGGESIWGEYFEDEIYNTALNFRGALSMAKTSEPNTNGSQFFIVQAKTITDQMATELERLSFPKEVIEKYKEVGGAPWLDGQYTVFGRVLQGMDVVDKIANLKVGSNDKPETDVKINSIEISSY